MDPSKTIDVCRAFDPQIDLTPVVQACTSCGGSGDPQQCAFCEGTGRKAGGDCPSCEGAKSVPCDCDGRGEINTTRSDITAYMRDRKVEHLSFVEPSKVVWFRLRPITRRERREFVDAVPGPMDDEAAMQERYTRAFQTAVTDIIGAHDDEGNAMSVNLVRKNGRIQDTELDKLQELGFGDYDVYDIGSVAYWRAKLPFGIAASYQPPRSSLSAIRMRMQSFLRAAGGKSKTTGSTATTPPSETPGDAPAPAPETPGPPPTTSAEPSPSGSAS